MADMTAATATTTMTEAAGDATVIAAEGLAHRWPGAAEWTFRDVALTVRPGEILAILGRNGRGKTTLLKTLIGLAPLAAGTVRLAGTAGYVPQAFETPFAYTVRDVVVMGRARSIGWLSSPGRADYAAVDAVLAELGLTRFADRPASALSGGERQMVLIARALVGGGGVLLLDEPTAALDFRNQEVVLSTLRRLAAERGIAMVMTTHHPQHAELVADRVLLMADGEGCRCGPAGEVLTEAALGRLYGVGFRRAVVDRPEGAHRVLVPVFAS
jgi:iron complex transport system ATP-binding protein